MLAQWEQDHQIDSRPAFLHLAEDDEGEQPSGGLNYLVSRNAGGAQWTWRKVIVVVDSGAAENVMPRRMFPEISTDETMRSKSGKGCKKNQEESTSRFTGSRSFNSSGICTQEIVAGCRPEKASSVSIPHHPSRERLVHREG